MRRALITLLSCSSLLLSLLASSALAQDIGAAQEAVCCGVSCCLIDGVCASGNPDNVSHVNPRNPCEVCDPAMSQFEWTAVDGCVAPDSGTPAVEPDAGTVPPPSGGGCSATGAGAPLGLGLALGAAALALVWRRRR